MSKTKQIKFEQAIRLLVKYLPIFGTNSRKPILAHDIRVGVYLEENGYSENIVLAGVLHDALEWSGAKEKILRDEFGDDVVRLIVANTKDKTIADNDEKINDLVRRCVKAGQDALIVKAADTIDSFKWYASQDNKGELEYCRKNANAILKYKPQDFEDKIFEELKIIIKQI